VVVEAVPVVDQGRLLDVDILGGGVVGNRSRHCCVLWLRWGLVMDRLAVGGEATTERG
jgi:hypothetical protein